MIRYALRCSDDHAFESWFKSADAFDALQASGHVACPECGSARVEKAVMAPQVRPSRKASQAPVAGPAPAGARPAAAPPPAHAAAKAERQLAALRRKIEAECDYVGPRFAAEARKMHLGEAEERSIYGEAKPTEARQLLEDGIPVAPLPFVPKHKTN